MDLLQKIIWPRAVSVNPCDLDCGEEDTKVYTAPLNFVVKGCARYRRFYNIALVFKPEFCYVVVLTSGGACHRYCMLMWNRN